MNGIKRKTIKPTFCKRQNVRSITELVVELPVVWNQKQLRQVCLEQRGIAEPSTRNLKYRTLRLVSAKA